jgi:Ku protein
LAHGAATILARLSEAVARHLPSGDAARNLRCREGTLPHPQPRHRQPQSHYVDAETGKPVADADQVKGYERDEGEYVMLEDEELDAVALDSARTIDIDCFVPTNSIGWIWYDKPHYLIPDDKVGEEAFSVIREAMVKSNTRAISRVVLYHRERRCCWSRATTA